MFSFLIFEKEKEKRRVNTYTLLREFYYLLIINRYLPKHQSVGRLIHKIPKYLTNGRAKDLCLYWAWGPTYLGPCASAHLVHPLGRA